MNLFNPAFKLIVLFCAVSGASFFTPEKLDTAEIAGPQYV